MSARAPTQLAAGLLPWSPFAIFICVAFLFGSQSPQFVQVQNLQAVLVQSSWLVIVASGVNFTLLSAGIDLSVGSAMYLAAVAAGVALPQAPVWLSGCAALITGAVLGAVNATLLVQFRVPAFIVTLAMLFVGRGAGLFASSTRVIRASDVVAQWGRSHLLAIPVSVWIAGAAVTVSWLLLNRTPFGPYMRSIGADATGAKRVGVPVASVTASVYVLCGAFAGLAGFVSFSQTAAASGAFGQNAEFLAIAAAVLGGTSLSGGRGHFWTPVVGALLITMVQNGLALVNANPYLYPVITGAVILLAALLDSLRLQAKARLERRPILAIAGGSIQPRAGVTSSAMGSTAARTPPERNSSSP